MGADRDAWQDRLLAATDKTLSDLKAQDDPRLLDLIADVRGVRDRLLAEQAPGRAPERPRRRPGPA